MTDNAYGSKRLNLRRPPLEISVAQVIGGLLIVGLACIGLAFNYHSLTDILRAPMLAGPLGRWGLTSYAYLLAIGIAAFGFIPVVLVELGNGLASIYKALVDIVRPLRLAQCPADFGMDEADWAGDKPGAASSRNPVYGLREVKEGLRNRSVPTYQPIGDRHRFAAILFGPNTMFLPPVRRNIVLRISDDLKKRLGRFVLLLALAGAFVWFVNWLPSESAGRLIPVRLAREVTALFLQESTWMLLSTPFVALVIVYAVIAPVEYVAGFLMIPRAQPDSVPHEDSEDYRGFGHPLQVLNRLPEKSAGLTWEGFPNRYQRPTELKSTATTGLTDAATFRTGLFVEQQPQPIPRPDIPSAYLLLGVGWLLRLAALALFLFYVLPDPVRQMASAAAVAPYPWAPVYVGIVLAAAWSARCAGEDFVTYATSLFQSARFRSTAILIEFEGSLTRSDLRVGKAMIDSVESSNVAVRSDFTARFWAGELLSEARSLDRPRRLLAICQTEESHKWIDFFRQQIAQMREEGVQILGLDLQSREAAQVVQANVNIAALQASARESVQALTGVPLGGVLPAAPPVPQLAASWPVGRTEEHSEAETISPPAGPFDPAQWKECPECAEVIRAKAKKCRFCGHVFA